MVESEDIEKIAQKLSGECVFTERALGKQTNMPRLVIKRVRGALSQLLLEHRVDVPADLCRLLGL